MWYHSLGRRLVWRVAYAFNSQVMHDHHCKHVLVAYCHTQSSQSVRSPVMKIILSGFSALLWKHSLLFLDGESCLISKRANHTLVVKNHMRKYFTIMHRAQDRERKLSFARWTGKFGTSFNNFLQNNLKFDVSHQDVSLIANVMCHSFISTFHTYILLYIYTFILGNIPKYIVYRCVVPSSIVP